MAHNNFERLIQSRGKYTLPFLIKIYSSDGNIVLRYINDNQSILFHGEVYEAGTFNYKPSSFVHGFSGEATLEISLYDKNIAMNKIVDLVETYKDVHLEVVGVFLQEGFVQELQSFKHHFGKVDIDGKTAKFQFTKDDRLSMTFPALIWNVFNNRGNA